MPGASGYTREELADAVRCSVTLPEAVIRLGAEPTKGRCAYVRRLLTSWEIDTRHLRPAYVRHTERDLRAAAAASASVAEVVRRLGISPVGGNQAHIGRRLAQLAIDTSHFTRGRAGAARGPGRSRELLSLGAPEEGRVPGVRLLRALVREGVRERCQGCGTGPRWQGRPLRLEVDHLNGQWWDNRRGNLRLLCPNCHSVTGNYRGRGRRVTQTG